MINPDCGDTNLLEAVFSQKRREVSPNRGLLPIFDFAASASSCARLTAISTPPTTAGANDKSCRFQ